MLDLVRAAMTVVPSTSSLTVPATDLEVLTDEVSIRSSSTSPLSIDVSGPTTDLHDPTNDGPHPLVMLGPSRSICMTFTRMICIMYDIYEDDLCIMFYV